MDLDTLLFRVDSTQLDEARIKIAKLGDAVGALNKPLQDMARSSAKTNEVIAKSELAAEKARVATKALADTTGKVAEEIDPLTKLITKLSNQYTDMASGFTKGESSILNQARSMGVFGAELQPIISLLEKIKTLNKDPFDASLGGVRSITQEFEKLQQRANLAAQGIMLTTKQLGEYSKLAAEAAGKVEGMGFDPKQGEGLAKYNQLLADSQNKYLETVASVNKLTQAEKDRNAALKQQEQVLASNKAISDAMIRETAGQVGQKSPELKQMAEFYKKQAAEADKLTKAQNLLVASEERLRFVNEQLAAGLTTASANALLKYKQQLEQVGTSYDLVAKKMQAFKEQLVVRQGYSPIKKLADDTADVNKRLDHLSRALGPQITDIFVGLATGQNLLTVALQQGGQIRDQVALAGVESSKMGKALSDSAVLMVKSLKDVATAMGSLLMTPFIAAGKAATDFGLSIIGMSDKYKLLRVQMAMTEDAGGKFATVVYRVLGVIPALVGSAIAVFTTMGVAMVAAFFQVDKQLNALTTNLILTGGSLGLTTDSAVRMTQSMEQVGISSSKALDVITAMAKQGGFAAKEIELVTKSAVDMQKWLGVSVEDTVKQYSKLKGEPVDALIEIAKQTGLVDSATLATVISLKEQGKTAEAAAVAMKAYGDVTVAQVQRAKQEYTEFAQLMISISEKLGKFWDGIKSVWIKASPGNQLNQQISDLNAAINTPGIGSEYKKQLEAQKEILQEQVRMLNITASARDQEIKKNSDSAKVMERANKVISESKDKLTKLNEERVAENNYLEEQRNAYKQGNIDLESWTKTQEANKLKIAKLDKDIADAKKKENAEAASEAKKQENYYKTLLDQAKDYYAKMIGGAEELSKAEIALLGVKNDPRWQKLTEREKQELTVLWQKNAALEEQNRLYNAQRKIDISSGEARNKLISDGIKEIESINQRVAEQGILNNLLDYEMSLTGVTVDRAQYLVELKKEELEYQKKINDLKSKGLTSAQEQDALDALEKEFELRKRNLDVKTYKKEFEALQKELGDIMFLALTNRGASAGKKLRDLIKAELMKPITVLVNAVVGDIINAFTGKSGAAAVGESAIGSMASSALTGTVIAGSSLAAIGSSIATGFTATLGGSSVAAASSAYSAAGMGGVAAGLEVGAALATYGPYVLAAYLALDSLGVLDNWSGDPDAFLVQQGLGTKQAYKTSTASRLGTIGFVSGNASIMKNGQMINEYGQTQDISVKAQNSALEVIRNLDNAIASTLSESQIKEIATNMSGWYQKSWSVESDTIEKFIASRYETVLGMLDSSFTKLKDYQKEGEKLADTAVRLVTNFSTMQNVFKDLGISTEVVTVTFATSLADMLGGIASFSSSMQYFYDNFFSEPEQIANQTRKLTEAFDALGKTLPKTKQEFRTLLEGALSSGDKGLAASLLGLMQPFNEFINTTEQAAASMQDLTDSLLEEVNRLRGAILGSSSASGNVQGLTAEFAVLTAQARAGNATAIEKLPEYSKAIEEAVLATATSSTDVLYARAWLANSLSNTSGVLTGIQPQAAVAAGSFTEDVASPVSASMTDTGSVAGAGTTAQQDLIAALVAEVQGLRAEVRADVAANSKTSKILERANQDGETLSISGSIDGGTV